MTLPLVRVSLCKTARSNIEGHPMRLNALLPTRRTARRIHGSIHLETAPGKGLYLVCAALWDDFSPEVYGRTGNAQSPRYAALRAVMSHNISLPHGDGNV